LFSRFDGSRVARLASTSTSKDEPAFWLYSSGSTGVPKGASIFITTWWSAPTTTLTPFSKLTSATAASASPASFLRTVSATAGYFPLSCGATHLFPRSSGAASIYADIERYRPTLFFSVPTNYAALLDHHCTSGPDFDLSSIRHAVSAGELYLRLSSNASANASASKSSTPSADGSLHMVISIVPAK